MFRYKNGLSQVITEKKVQCKFMSETLFISCLRHQIIVTLKGVRSVLNKLTVLRDQGIALFHLSALLTKCTEDF